MTEPNEHNVIKDVFIVYSSANKADVTGTILPVLKDAGLVVTYDNDFLPGRSTVRNIADAVFSSKKTLIFLTRESMKSTWCRLELVVALEKTQKTNVHSVVLLLNGLEEIEMKTLNFLRIAPKVVMEPGKTDWKEKLVDHLQKDVSVHDSLPVGNVGHGYAYSHFNGFLRHVLPELEKMAKQSKLYETKKMPAVLFEMIPQSCNCPARLTDVIPDMKEVDKLEIKYYSAGNLRILKILIYSLADNDGNEYYCMCEYPSVIRALHVMDKYHLANITDEERRLQLVRFYYTMNAILYNTYLGKGVGRGKLLLFNDEHDNPKDVLLRDIKKELKELPQTNEDQVTDPLSRLTSGIDTLRVREDYQFDVFIVCPCEKDTVVGQTIKEYLQTKNMTCLFSREMPEKTLIQCILEGLKKCRWLILVYSKDVVHDNWLPFECLQAIQKSVAENNIRLIPVLNGVDHTHIPDSLSWLTFLDSSDEQYLKKIEMALKNLPIELETMLPAGNVSDGLAWGFFANYLEFILPELESIIEEVEEQLENAKFSHKFLLLIPQSCECPSTLTESDKRIEKYEHRVITKKDMGGSLRPYHCDIYKIQNYYFFGQFPAPIQCLRNMFEMRIAGLNENDMQREAESFRNKIEIILQTQNLMDKCCFLSYNDNTQAAGDVVLSELTETQLYTI